MNKKALLSISGIALAVGLVAFLGCQSGNTGGGTVDHTTNQYDPNGSGTMTLELVDGDLLTTGKIEGFFVLAKDANGQPIVQMPVTCDTEKGLALIEPTTGVENTDSGGGISGKVGCEKPGSYLLACRLEGVSARRKSVTVRCDGAIPTGFNGFPGAGGGGLGGGSANNTTLSGARINTVEVSDDGAGTATTSIDIVQSCPPSNNTPVIEKFYDSQVKFTVVNNTPYLIKFTSMRYSLSNAFANGRTCNSGSLKLTGSGAAAVDANGGTGTMSSLLFDAANGTKYCFGNKTNPISSGFKNITFTLDGETELGDKFSLTASTALSFDNFNHCS